MRGPLCVVPRMPGYPPVITGTPADISDTDLIRNYADGDTEALGILCERHGTKLKAAAAKIAGQDADDAVQDGCLKAYFHAGRFRGDSAVGTWLYRIVMNAAHDIVRRRPLVAEITNEPPTDPGVGHADIRIDIETQWQRISPDHRAALLLVDMMGYPIAEAAEILKVSEGTMKSRAARGRAALAGKLG